MGIGWTPSTMRLAIVPSCSTVTVTRSPGEQPFETALLTATALGIACFGLYCFAWSRHAKKT